MCVYVSSLHVSHLFVGSKPLEAHNDTCAWTPNRGGPTERAPKEEIRSSEIPNVRFFGKIAGNEFSKRVFEESFCRECTWRAYATFHRGISCHLSRGSVFFLESPIFVLILSADFELGAECLPSDGLPLPGGGLKGRLAPLGFDLGLWSHDFMA